MCLGLALCIIIKDVKKSLFFPFLGGQTRFSVANKQRKNVEKYEFQFVKCIKSRFLLPVSEFWLCATHWAFLVSFRSLQPNNIFITAALFCLHLPRQYVASPGMFKQSSSSPDRKPVVVGFCYVFVCCFFFI